MQTYKKKFNSNEKKRNFINKANIIFLKKVFNYPKVNVYYLLHLLETLRDVSQTMFLKSLIL